MRMDEQAILRLVTASLGLGHAVDISNAKNRRHMCWQRRFRWWLRQLCQKRLSKCNPRESVMEGHIAANPVCHC